MELEDDSGARPLDAALISVYTAIGSFEWDHRKARRNVFKHGIDFRAAAFAFDDPHALIIEDDRHSAQEPRQRLIGDSGSGVLVIVFTVRANSIRIISARRSSRKERRHYAERKAV